MTVGSELWGRPEKPSPRGDAFVERRGRVRDVLRNIQRSRLRSNTLGVSLVRRAKMFCGSGFNCAPPGNLASYPATCELE